MKWFIITLLFSLHLSINLTANVALAEDNIRVTINGEIQEYDQPPVIIDGRTLVPLRGIFESLGATIEWDSNTNEVHAILGLTEVDLKIGDENAFVNKALRKLDVAPQLVNGRTMVPARFVAEALGASVTWDETSNTVIIKKEDDENPQQGEANQNGTGDNVFYVVDPDYTKQEEKVEQLRNEVEVLGRQIRGIDTEDEYTQDTVVEYEKKYQEYYRNLRKLRTMEKYLKDI